MLLAPIPHTSRPMTLVAELKLFAATRRRSSFPPKDRANTEGRCGVQKIPTQAGPDLLISPKYELDYVQSCTQLNTHMCALSRSIRSTEHHVQGVNYGRIIGPR